MDLFEAIQARQSVRAYRPQPVEPEKLQAILAAANQAPSAGNLQPFQIYLVRNPDVKRALAKACMDQNFMNQAPVHVIFCTDPARATKYGKRGEEFFALQDATIAVAYAQLAATALGLATCWIGAFEDAPIQQIAGLPPSHRPVAILTLGYAAETPQRTSRRPLQEVVVDKG